MTKGFKDSKGKFRPTSSSSGLKSNQIGLNKNTRERMFSQLQKRGVLINRPNPSQLDRQPPKPKGSLEEILQSPNVVVDSEHTVGKIQNAKVPDNYFMSKPIALKETITRTNKTNNKVEDFKLYNVGHGAKSVISGAEIVKIAKDARLQGLIPNAMVETVIDRGKFFASNQKDKVVLIFLGKTTYLIAPHITDSDF